MSPPLASRTRHVSSHAIHTGACSSPRVRKRRRGRRHSARWGAKQSPELTRSMCKGSRTQHIQSLSWHPISPSWSARWTSPQTCHGFASCTCALRSPCCRQPGHGRKEDEHSTPSRWSWTPDLALANPGLWQETHCHHHAHHVGKLGASCQDSWPGASGPLSKDYLSDLSTNQILESKHCHVHKSCQLPPNIMECLMNVMMCHWIVMDRHGHGVMEWNATHEMECDMECRNHVTTM